MKIMVIKGPNLNFTGIREKEVYGAKTFKEICTFIQTEGENRKHDLTLFQSNSEGEIIDALQKAFNEQYDGIIINPGAYTHYSYAIHDAIKSIQIATVEVHMSNIHQREDFRKISVTAPACIGQVTGFGTDGYLLAMDALNMHQLKQSEGESL